MPPKRIVACAVALVLAVSAALVGGLSQPTPAHALDGSQFDPGEIISDANFYDSAAMTQADIQAFLSSKAGCGNSQCLTSGQFPTSSKAADAMCQAYAGGGTESAAAIIFKVQQACSISAKVILVTLQKEQGLVTTSSPTTNQIYKAMGYACPDTSACDTTYYGLFNQIYSAAHQLVRYGNPPGTSNYFTWFPVGSPVAVRYSTTPPPDCGAPVITIKNKATAALYYYTPYQPDPAALANLYGVGGACSSYGNRNFWVYYNQWFGDPVGGGNPFGNIELLKGSPGKVQVSGWAIDPDTSAPITVHVYVGAVGTPVQANLTRSDVAAAYPGLGTQHGFNATVPVTQSGPQQVCVYAINVGSGGNTVLGCQTLTLYGGSPFGSMEAATQNADGTATVAGWAIDPDVTTPITVHLYVDGVGVAYTADKVRADVAALYPDYGGAHGYQLNTPVLSPGPHTICVYGINTGAGANASFGCQDVVRPGAIPEQGRAPVGALESITTQGSTISASGWAIDPDTASPIKVHVYVDSTGTPFTASGLRADVAKLYPDYGPAHGFSAQVTSPIGPHNVCVYAINTGAGGNTLLGCKQVVVQGTVTEQGRPPIGNLENISVASDGTVSVSGWALDPDTVASIPVHVYIDGAGTALTADGTRADVARVYPAYGSWHGFSAQLKAGGGNHTVCVYAINTGAGGNVVLGCKGVAVPTVIADQGRPPIGNLDSVQAVAGGIRTTGWTIDPDTVAPITVHIYVDATGAPYQADRQRSDVGAIYPVYGASHGFDQTITAAPGTHTVCVYAINTGPGGNVALGCRSVLVS
ncbi:hypothetical protein ACFRFH_14170 [Leifsonia sp. NPDC056824]|uniref:hypothetical protein n=1 Tax=Leifsonia sp. NPDC056824 TaxID=3345953 RepID=UPI003673F1D6